MKIENIKNIIQSSHINFLFGSGVSQPYLSTLGKIEKWMAESENIECVEERKIIQASLFGIYFKNVMQPCLYKEYKKKENNDNYNLVLENYKSFLKKWNEILAKRNVGLLDKKVNIFTTNIDNFVETAAENVGVEFNDGFSGHLKPIFREGSFSNVISKVSSLYQNSSMIPVFNYMKIHGSINWNDSMGKVENEIEYDMNLKLIEKIAVAYDKLDSIDVIKDIEENSTFEDIRKKALIIMDLPFYEKSVLDEFLELYSKLVMIHPRKTKFRESVLELHFYELMRLYSNALECTSSLLIVAGFSFADEHIAKITLRAANSNPTLLILIFAYDDNAKKEIEKNLLVSSTYASNNNIKILTTDIFKKAQDKDFADKELSELANFDLSSINKYVFDKLGSLI